MTWKDFFIATTAIQPGYKRNKIRQTDDTALARDLVKIKTKTFLKT